MFCLGLRCFKASPVAMVIDIKISIQMLLILVLVE